MPATKSPKNRPLKREPRRKTPYNKKGRAGFLPGNPGGGRPKGSFSMRTLLRQQIQKLRGKAKRPLAEDIIDSMLAAALQGKPWAVQMAFEHIDGKPTQTVVTVEETADLGAQVGIDRIASERKRRKHVPPEEDQ